MNKKDILTDFTTYLLLLGDEFRNDELQFFDKYTKKEAIYKNYLSAINTVVDVEDFLWDSDIDKPLLSKINSLSDLISNKEIEFLQDYIKNKFDFGYPTEIDEDGLAFGHSYTLDFTIDEIKSHFENYVELRKFNTVHYITYYEQYLNYLHNHAKNTIQATKNKIDNFSNNKGSIDSYIYSELKDKLESELKTNLLKSVQNTSFQVQGGFDKFGFILNYDDTLSEILKQNNTIYTKLNLDIEPKQYFALAKYEYFLYKFQNKQAISKTEKQKSLEKEFEILKEKNAKQIQFLKDKSFDYHEIEIILNCFSLNKYNSLNIRHIRNPKKVDFFGLFYFFHRFEFIRNEYNIVFDIENDFIKIPLTGSINKNDYKKYYQHSNDVIIHNQKHDKRYPFKNAQKLINSIKSELHIDINKLNIPSFLKKHL